MNWWVEVIEGGNFDQGTSIQFYPSSSSFLNLCTVFRTMFEITCLEQVVPKRLKFKFFNLQSMFDFSLIRYMFFTNSFQSQTSSFTDFLIHLLWWKKVEHMNWFVIFLPWSAHFLDTVLIILITMLIIFVVISRVKGWYWIRPVTLLSFHLVSRNQESLPSLRFHSC